jgi:hypothetical protein
MEAQGRSKSLTPLFFILGDIWGWAINATLQPLYPRGRAPVHMHRRLVGLDVSEKRKSLVPTGVRTTKRPTRSESLYRLRYPASLLNYYYWTRKKIT